ncbi:MAG: c-type cytochrome [Burkholderiaceae bacterium]
MKTIQTLALAAALACVSGAAMADAGLAKSKNCMTCHAEAKKMIGPSYKDVAKKYGNDANAVAYLSEKIMKGSTRVWGPIPMPANPSVSAAEAETLAKWILSLK